MFKTSMTFNGKKITSAAQLGREFKKAARNAVEEQVRRTAQPGVRVSKTRDGYKLEGPQEAIERTMIKLGARERRAR
jgi:biotin operon repressor